MKLIDKQTNQICPDLEIKSKEYITLLPGERKLIELPYHKTYDCSEYIVFEPNLLLINQGILIPYNNFNLENSQNSLQIFLININIDNPLINNSFDSIFGSRNKITIKPNMILGRIFVI
jgi:hypothetical protein